MNKNLIWSRLRETKGRKKGISLAIDTTIIIILAVVVLVILISLLLLVSGPTQSEFQARLTQSQVCGNYRNTDAKCEGGAKYAQFVSDGNNENLLKDLNRACSTLRIAGCSGGSGDDVQAASESCIKACCPGCTQSTDQNTPSQNPCDGSCVRPNQCDVRGTGSCDSGFVCCAETI